jgi:NDP-sugar pyrophosphorylase family protein
MKAMIFAAGLGTRLRPLTNDRPKALVEVGGLPLLEIAIRRMKKYGCTGIIVNIHHFGEQVIDFLAQKENFGLEVAISDERDLLLDTGGGLKKAAWFLKDAPFLVLNADILTNIDLQAFYQQHVKSGALSTLACRQRESSRYFLFDEKGQLSGWRNEKSGETRMARPQAQRLQAWCFSGMHAMSPAIFEHLQSDQPVFSIIETYLKAAESEKILLYPHNEDIWLDVGKVPAVEQAEEMIGLIDF